MPKKLIISLLLLMLIASLYGYFKFSQYSQEPTSNQQSSSITIFPNEKISKAFDLMINDQKTSTVEAEISSIKPNIVDTESKVVDSLEILGTITNRAGEGIAGVLVLGKGEFPPAITDANGQYHLVFQKPGFTDLILNFSFSGYEKQKSRITINEFKKSPILNWDVTLAEAIDTQSTTSVSGKVSNLVGEGLANQRIRLITLGDPSDRVNRHIDFGLTDKDGYFTLSGISINTNYKFIVLAADNYSNYIVNELLVTNDTPDLDIILEDRKFINKIGLVIDREGVPVPNLKISANSNANNIANGKYSTNLVTDNSGGFHLENFPEGEISFSIESPANIKISGIQLSEMDSQTNILTVDIGNHFLSGLVSDNAGLAIEGAIVTLQSTYLQNGKSGVTSNSLRSVTTDSRGAFAFDNFGADEHIIIILSNGFKQKMIVHQPHTSDTHLNIILERR